MNKIFSLEFTNDFVPNEKKKLRNQKQFKKQKWITQEKKKQLKNEKNNHYNYSLRKYKLKHFSFSSKLAVILFFNYKTQRQQICHETDPLKLYLWEYHLDQHI